MKTYELVSKGYDEFLASKLQTIATDSNAPPAPEEPA
jgi:hypothetical protein